MCDSSRKSRSVLGLNRARSDAVKKSDNRSTERRIRDYALHLGLMVRKRGSVLALYERSDQKRKIGEYRTLAAVERAIVQYGDDWRREYAKKKKAASIAQRKRPVNETDTNARTWQNSAAHLAGFSNPGTRLTDC
jgi:hypothetical protein